MTHAFSARLQIIDGNPFVAVPGPILLAIFEQAGTDKSPIPIKGTVNGKPYIQTLVKFRGDWRLYINMKMLKNSPQRIGETVDMTVAFDPVKREELPNPAFLAALDDCPEAKEVFDSLSPSFRKEILRYLNALKNEDSLTRNITRAINFLLGKERFVGRDHP